MEMDKTYASNGKGNLGVVLGAIGTGLSAFNGNNGVLGNIFGGNTNVLNDRINALQPDLAKERSERYTDQKFCELKSDICNRFDMVNAKYDSKFDAVNSALCSQSVWNATNTSTISCLTNQINTLTDSLNALIVTGISSSKVLSASTSTT